MDNDVRADSDDKKGNDESSGFVGEEKSLDGFTKEEVVDLAPKEVLQSAENEG